MSVNSDMSSPIFGDAFKSQAIALASITATATAGTAVDFGADFYRYNGTVHNEVVDLDNSVLSRLTLFNTHATLTVFVHLDGITNAGATRLTIPLAPGTAMPLAAYATTMSMALIESTGAAVVTLLAQFTSVNA